MTTSQAHALSADQAASLQQHLTTLGYTSKPAPDPDFEIVSQAGEMATVRGLSDRCAQYLGQILKPIR